MTNARQATILNTLIAGPSTSIRLAAVTGAPTPSIRRSIIALRAQGHDIRSANGVYTRYPVHPTTAVVVPDQQTVSQESV